MNEQSRVMASAVVGALIGAAAGYLFFTERGRDVARPDGAGDGRPAARVRAVPANDREGGRDGIDGMRVVHEFNTRALAVAVSAADVALVAADGES